MCLSVSTSPFIYFLLRLLHAYRGSTMCKCSDPAPSAHQDEGAYLEHYPYVHHGHGLLWLRGLTDLLLKSLVTSTASP